MKSRKLYLLLLLTTILLFLSTTAGATTHTIKFGLSNAIDTPESDIEATWALTFKQLVEEKTNGDIIVDLYPNKQLGSASEMLNGVASGIIEMSVTNSNSFASLYPNSMVLSCPGVFSSEKEIDDVLETSWAKDFFADMADATNCLVLSARSNGMRCFTTSNKKLTTVDTAKGVTWRVMESPLMVVMVESLGANAVPMAGSEMYTAMQNGTVDGQENPIAAILNDRTYEVQKYMVVDNHTASIVCFVINQEFFNSLSDEYKAILTEASEIAGIAASKVTENINMTGIDKLREFGMEVYIPTEAELADWHSPILSACSAYIEKELGNKLLEELIQTVADYRAK